MQQLSCAVTYSQTGAEHLSDADIDTVFVVESFDSDVYRQLHDDECRIVAPPVLYRAAQNKQVLSGCNLQILLPLPFLSVKNRHQSNCEYSIFIQLSILIVSIKHLF